MLQLLQIPHKIEGPSTRSDFSQDFKIGSCEHFKVAFQQLHPSVSSEISINMNFP